MGNPLEESTDVGPLIDEASADRVMSWIEEAVSAGARVVQGGRRISRTVVEPTVVVNVPNSTKLFRKEVFGPVVLVNRVSGLEEGIEEINNSAYGLQAGIFTNDIRKAYRFAEEVDCGGIMINEVPTFRVDQMPYGGVKESGIGREGPRFALEEMTEIKTICMDVS